MRNGPRRASPCPRPGDAAAVRPRDSTGVGTWSCSPIRAPTMSGRGPHDVGVPGLLAGVITFHLDQGAAHEPHAKDAGVAGDCPCQRRDGVAAVLVVAYSPRRRSPSEHIDARGQTWTCEGLGVFEALYSPAGNYPDVHWHSPDGGRDGGVQVTIVWAVHADPGRPDLLPRGSQEPTCSRRPVAARLLDLRGARTGLLHGLLPTHLTGRGFRVTDSRRQGALLSRANRSTAGSGRGQTGARRCR